MGISWLLTACMICHELESTMWLPQVCSCSCKRGVGLWVAKTTRTAVAPHLTSHMVPYSHWLIAQALSEKIHPYQLWAAHILHAAVATNHIRSSTSMQTASRTCQPAGPCCCCCYTPCTVWQAPAAAAAAHAPASLSSTQGGQWVSLCDRQQFLWQGHRVIVAS